MSGFGVPVKVETLTDINQALINIQRTLSDLFSSLVSVTVQGPPGPAGPPGSGTPGPAGPAGPGGLWFAAQVNSTAARLLNTAGVLDVVSVLGVNTNSNAAAGTVGEFISATVPSGSAVALGSGVPSNVTTISLTAGDWDVWANVVFDAAPTTTITVESGGISLTSVTLPTPPATGAYFSLSAAFATGGDNAFPVGTTRLSVASTTLVFLVVNATFAVSTLSAYGFLGARRRR